MKLLDLSKFQKVAEDKHMTTMRHEDGHEMKILNKMLPRIHQEQLKRLKMAEGGHVKGVHESDEPEDDSLAGESPAGTYARASTKTHNPAWKQAAKKEHQKVLGEIKDMKGKNREYLAEGGEAGTSDSSGQAPLQIDPVDPTSADAQAPSTPDHSTTININAAPAPGAAPVQSPPQTVQTPQVGQASQGPQYNSGTGLQSQAANTLTAIQAQQNAANRQANEVDIPKAKAVAAATQANITALSDAAQQDKQALAEVTQHTNDFRDYVDQHPIEANSYLNNLSAPGKVSTAIGLLLGGIAGKGQANVVQNFLNDQINRDIDAQKKNVENQHSVWGAYQQLYGDSNVSTNLAKVSANNLLTKAVELKAAQLGTQQALINAQQFKAQKELENTQLRMDAAGILGNGYRQSGASQVTPGATAPGSQSPGGNYILSPDAQNKYQMIKYDPASSPEQKGEIQKEYVDAIQTERALKQIDALYPQLEHKATYGGYFANKVNPHVVAGIAGAGAEGIGALGAPATGGTSLLAAAPAAAIAAALGEGAGHFIKQGLTATGGQQEQQYQTAKAALIGQIGNALKGTQVTPTEIESLADQFVPTKLDSEETAADKLQKLKDKIITLTKTGALSAHGMTKPGI